MGGSLGFVVVVLAVEALPVNELVRKSWWNCWLGIKTDKGLKRDGDIERIHLYDARWGPLNGMEFCGW